jgi:hypothetical protein
MGLGIVFSLVRATSFNRAAGGSIPTILLMVGRAAPWYLRHQSVKRSGPIGEAADSIILRTSMVL